MAENSNSNSMNEMFSDSRGYYPSFDDNSYSGTNFTASLDSRTRKSLDRSLRKIRPRKNPQRDAAIYHWTGVSMPCAEENTDGVTVDGDGLANPELYFYKYKFASDDNKAPSDPDRMYVPKNGQHPYYMKLDPTVRQNFTVHRQIGEGAIVGHAGLYVSLNFLHDLATQTLHENTRNMNGVAYIRKHLLDKERGDFDQDLRRKDFAALFDVRNFFESPSCSWFPLRSQTGAICWANLGSTSIFSNDIRDMWAKFWRENTVLEDAKKKTSWARHQFLKVPPRTGGHPGSGMSKLFIMINRNVASSRLQRGVHRYTSLDDIFTIYITAINQEHAETGSGVSLELFGDKTHHVSGKYMRLSVNPFELYSTWATNESFQNYLAYISPEGNIANGVRDFPTISGYQELSEDISKKYPLSLPKLEATQKMHQFDLVPGSEKWPSKDESKIQNKSLGNEKNNNKKDVGIKKGVRACETWMVTHVDNRKMEKAAKVARKPPGGIVGFSAPNFAAEALEWKCGKKLDLESGKMIDNRQLANSLYIAEWLHLSAYSWGGLSSTNNEDAGEPATSDIPANLVLGTSETNSEMTRYEKAWQNLIRDELVHQGSEFPATLSIVRNPPSENGTYESYNEGWSRTADNYKYREVTYKPDDPQMQLAAEIPYVAYTISYRLKLRKTSKILGVDKGYELATRFYPFSRSFFHTLEHRLDTALYEHMKVIAEDEALGAAEGVAEAQVGSQEKPTFPVKFDTHSIFGTGNKSS